AQLATLRVRVYGHQGTAPKGAVQNVNWVGLYVTLTPAANTAGLAHGTGAAQGAAGAVAVSAVLPSGTGAAPVTPAVAVNAVLPSGTGTAQGPAAAIGARAAPATGTGAAQSPAAAPVASVTATAATGAGTALNPAAAV